MVDRPLMWMSAAIDRVHDRESRELLPSDAIPCIRTGEMRLWRNVIAHWEDGASQC